MKVHMKVTAAGPGRYYTAGSIVDLSDDQAALYVKGGYADYLAEEAAAAEAEAAGEPARKNIAEMTKDELVAYAGEIGLVLKGYATKSAVQEAIEAFLAKKAE